MGLFDKFRKKKWEDDDPDVRIQGVSDLYNDKYCVHIIKRKNFAILI